VCLRRCAKLRAQFQTRLKPGCPSLLVRYPGDVPRGQQYFLELGVKSERDHRLHFSNERDAKNQAKLYSLGIVQYREAYNHTRSHYYMIK